MPILRITSSLLSSPNHYHEHIIYHICSFVFFQQEATDASYVATVKTVRQVKTVFIIFIAFVCCWIPYVVVLLYDSSDSLPLSVHLYTAMLAHLHANLNFAIYSLNNETCRAAYRRLGVRLIARCCLRTTPANAPAAAVVAYDNLNAHRTNERGPRLLAAAVDVSRALITVECHQLPARHSALL